MSHQLNLEITEFKKSIEKISRRKEELVFVFIIILWFLNSFIYYHLNNFYLTP